MTKNLLVICAVCTLILGACTSAEDVEQAASATATGSAFNKDLHKGYVGLAKAELKEGDQADAKHFALKAKEAAANKLVAPDDFKIRTISGPEDKTLKDARVRLVSALDSAEANKKPATAAKAQTMFDCWMQEQEEGWQQNDIAACRKGFEKAMAALGPKKTKKVASRSPYTVYFRFDKAELTERSEGALFDIMQDVRLNKPKKVIVSAYTDLSGKKGYNLKLAEKRAAMLKAKLEAGGAKNVEVLAKGAVDPLVDTQKPNQSNRRALIVFKK